MVNIYCFQRHRKSYYTIFISMILVLLSACLSEPEPFVENIDYMEELTFEQNRAMVPPSPKNLNINPEGNGVQIYWEASDPVTIPHGYGDEVLYFKVFRRAAGDMEANLLGITSEYSYLDALRAEHDRYYYSVVAVHKGLEGGEMDGERSEEIVWE